jgi:hypothetical protein
VLPPDFRHSSLMDDFESGLLRKINERIQIRGYCVVYDNDLSRLSGPLANLRAKQIREIKKFAEANGLAVELRDVGLNATFKSRRGGKLSSSRRLAAENIG